MAKSATATNSDQAQKNRPASARSSDSNSQRSGSDQRQSGQEHDDDEEMTAVDALVKLLESPLMIDLLAVGASAALAALAEHRFSRRRGATSGVKTSRALKTAGSDAVSAVSRRLSEEWEEIRSASERAKGGGEAA